MDFLRGGVTPFDGFLYATLGDDRRGNAVSVLSALARLGLDPWDEAAALSGLPRGGAEARLGDRLSRFRDVPGLSAEQGAILQRLLSLLPRDDTGREGADLVDRVRGRLGGTGPLIALLLLILFLVQTLVLGSSGSEG
ncbi:hypothetical protein HCU73_07700 [Roseibacterium sp. KMU-115]|uniref:Uncharacterized protein n=2 Tax=Roseicyclus persicicus TaxID=2650661 RepID=A0A7X6H066_9RHOB|nr:hypothetical protein [Roseibacterium persicicum]